MSNLNMPTMTHSALLRNYFARRGNPTRPIAYGTTATLVLPSEDVVVRHHGNAIAEIGATEVVVSNAGWSSGTTRARINAVLADNGLPFYVAQRQGAQVLYMRVHVLTDGIGEHIPVTREFRTAAFNLDTRVYSVNGGAVISF